MMLRWPHGLRRRSAAARLLILWVRIQPGAWMFVCCECCVLSGRGLCDELITRPEESYQMWCVVLCDLETSRMRRTWPALGRSATTKKKLYFTWVRADSCMSCYVEFMLPVLLPTSQNHPSGSLQLFLSPCYSHFHYNCAEVLKYIQ
jgi:hypothetical protein